MQPHTDAHRCTYRTRICVASTQSSAILPQGEGSMWQFFDPEMRRDLENIREMVKLKHLTPTREWPLIVEDCDADLLVVREWPNGSLTAYLMNKE